MLVAVSILGVICVMLASLVAWVFLRPKNETNPDVAMLLKTDMGELTKSMNSLKDGLQKQLSDQLGTSNKQMTAQF